MNKYDELTKRLESVAEIGITSQLRDLASQSIDVLEALQARLTALEGQAPAAMILSDNYPHLGVQTITCDRAIPIMTKLYLAAGATPASAAAPEKCPYCDGTGDVHRADGEWLGSCHCAAAPTHGDSHA